MTNSFNTEDGMTSRGITFRDPETGVLYLQTQLLQVKYSVYTRYIQWNLSNATHQGTREICRI